LHDPNSERAHKLGEVLIFLERRIDMMLREADDTSHKTTAQKTTAQKTPSYAAGAGSAIDASD
jgi:hypothetical protein